MGGNVDASDASNSPFETAALYGAVVARACLLICQQ